MLWGMRTKVGRDGFEGTDGLLNSAGFVVRGGALKGSSNEAPLVVFLSPAHPQCPYASPPAGSLDVEDACRGFLDLAKEGAAGCVATVFSDPAFAGGSGWDVCAILGLIAYGTQLRSSFTRWLKSHCCATTAAAARLPAALLVLTAAVAAAERQPPLLPPPLLLLSVVRTLLAPLQSCAAAPPTPLRGQPDLPSCYAHLLQATTMTPSIPSNPPCGPLQPCVACSEEHSAASLQAPPAGDHNCLHPTPVTLQTSSAASPAPRSGSVAS